MIIGGADARQHSEQKAGWVSRLGKAELGPAFWNGAATAAMPSGVLIFLFTFFIKEKSKKNIFLLGRHITVPILYADTWRTKK